MCQKAAHEDGQTFMILQGIMYMEKIWPKDLEPGHINRRLEYSLQHRDTLLLAILQGHLNHKKLVERMPKTFLEISRLSAQDTPKHSSKYVSYRSKDQTSIIWSNDQITLHKTKLVRNDWEGGLWSGKPTCYGLNPTITICQWKE